LLTPTSAVAIDMLAAAPSALRYSASTAFASLTSDASDSEPTTTRSSRARRLRNIARRQIHHRAHTLISRPITLAGDVRDAARSSIGRAARSSQSLLRARAGRLALDESPTSIDTRRHACRPIINRAVKNLRFACSAVLLLNFREVRDFHFCSISVAT
jgi:hypothetical protein